MQESPGYVLVEQRLPSGLRQALIDDAGARAFTEPPATAGGAFAMASLDAGLPPADAARWITDVAADRGFPGFLPNEASYQHYRAGGNGLPPHRDQRYYTTCIAVVTLFGAATFAVHGSRDRGDVVDEWTTTQGQVVLLRGWDPDADGDPRPYHRVDPPSVGSRLMFQLRHNLAGGDDAARLDDLTRTEIEQARSLAAIPAAPRVS